MKAWEIEYLPEALNDLERPERSVQVRVLKVAHKIATSPLPQREGDYGKPLGGTSGQYHCMSTSRLGRYSSWFLWKE